ncbi:YlmC/YmxH family sporulation protein [Clostridium gasigenes]|uniref:Sporulation protein, YlmC/YmxH family n=1 Tax=Clostridium gasigenes TaxID=94869 RepID=A0A1H0R6K3_9CLOT|nr:YlmC/YmxH family sporulation protein [Clostridium gasigenes]MBB6622951.1 YlmC/YmxH family sporulation protein [Clostridium gasigenes]MBB6715079.1 YlmC/YmxH family sporulation protein [Clostridium gasigenes]MBU3087721.1 YlmC/YmxH family sporulation protein [Clostridium gasigenes]MBU3104030.1 YlmC/YmxH family sporulation protein [Clostridium gasigenes]MBU3107090.1 YlmC/YmxH family sporulation protein [Clostridium gasigenes]
MRKQDYYEEEKRDSKYRLLSELERYEIFNTEEAEKYDTQQALDFIIDEKGNLQFIIAAVSGSKNGFFGGREYVEIPWGYVTKVGANVIVVSAEKDRIKRVRS